MPPQFHSQADPRENQTRVSTQNPACSQQPSVTEMSELCQRHECICRWDCSRDTPGRAACETPSRGPAAACEDKQWLGAAGSGVVGYAAVDTSYNPGSARITPARLSMFPGTLGAKPRATNMRAPMPVLPLFWLLPLVSVNGWARLPDTGSAVTVD